MFVCSVKFTVTAYSPAGSSSAMASDDRRTVVVSNLAPDMTTPDDVAVFFESPRYCPAGGDVTHVEMGAQDRSAVVTFKDKLGIEQH